MADCDENVSGLVKKFKGLGRAYSMADSDENVCGLIKKFKELGFDPERDSYQATNEETWEAYQALITIVESHTRANVPRKVLCSVADEVLWVLKNNTFLSPMVKKAEIEKVLLPIPYFIYNQLVSTANLITDYQNRNAAVVEKDFYQPRSEETWIAYKSLLNLVNEEFPSEPHVLQCILAHEVLVILKDGSIDNWKKRQMIGHTLQAASRQCFDALLSIAERITDFNYEIGPIEYMNDPAKEPLRLGFQYDFTVEEGMELQYDFEFDGFGEADEEAMDPNDYEIADNAVQSGSSTDDELMSMGFEKVCLSDQEDREDWVMVDFDD